LHANSPSQGYYSPTRRRFGPGRAPDSGAQWHPDQPLGAPTETPAYILRQPGPLSSQIGTLAFAFFVVMFLLSAVVDVFVKSVAM